MIAVIGFVLLSIQIVAYFYRRSTIPQPPQLQIIGVDPAIATEILEARQNVLDHPTSPFAWGHLGMCFLAHEFWQDASACLKQAERLDPSEPRWPYFNSIALQPVDYSAAVPQLQLAVSLSPAEVSAPRLQLSEMLFERGAFDESERLIRQVLQREPSNPRALLDLGQVQFARNDLAKASSSLAASVAIEPTRKITHVSLANVYRRMGDARGAEAEEAAAARLLDDSAWPNPWNDELDALRNGLSASLSRADRLIKGGRWNDAIGPLRQIADAYPDSSRAWMTLGMALQLQGNLGEAENALQKAAQIDPARADVQLTLAAVLLRRGRYAQAENASRAAVKIQPDLGDAWFVLGVALEKQARYKESLDPFRKAIQTEPQRSDPHVALANALNSLGQTEEARREIKLALQLAPDDSKAHQLLRQLPPDTRAAN